MVYQVDKPCAGEFSCPVAAKFDRLTRLFASASGTARFASQVPDARRMTERSRRPEVARGRRRTAGFPGISERSSARRVMTGEGVRKAQLSVVPRPASRDLLRKDD